MDAPESLRYIFYLPNSKVAPPCRKYNAVKGRHKPHQPYGDEEMSTTTRCRRLPFPMPGERWIEGAPLLKDIQWLPIPTTPRKTKVSMQYISVRAPTRSRAKHCAAG